MLPPSIGINVASFAAGAPGLAFVPCQHHVSFRARTARPFLSPLPAFPSWAKQSSKRLLPNPGLARPSSRRSRLVASANGEDPLGAPNVRLIASLLVGEGIVLAAAVGLGFLLKQNPLEGPPLSSLADPAVLAFAVLAAQPPFIISVLLEKSGISFFKKIDQDTRLYVLQLFGARRALPSVIAYSVALALSAGVAEELLFRGVIQQYLTGVIGPLGAVLVAAVLFGLAHDPVPGASAVVEAFYGLNFGLVYLLSGGNIWAAAVCHALYDVLTFGEVHWRAAGRVQEALKAGEISAAGKPGGAAMSGAAGGGRRPPQLDAKVAAVVREYKLAPEFVRVCSGVFQQLDLDGNGSIDARELRLGIRTFGANSSEKEVDEILARADADGDNALSFGEFLRLIAEDTVQGTIASGKKGSRRK